MLDLIVRAGLRVRPTRAVVTAATMAAMALSGCSPSSPPDGSTPPAAPAGDVDRGLPGHLASSVREEGVYAHLEALQAIADRHSGNRALGTPGYNESVDYLAMVLRQAGFEVQTPEFTAPVEGENDDAGRASVTRNVVVETSTGRADEVVLAGAHLDSVSQGPGLDDDGSGVAALLETALRLGSKPPVANKVRFVWFGAEEEGLLGSQSYVASLSEDKRRDVALMLNFDMIAGANAGYFVYDSDGSDGRGEAAVLGSGAIERELAEHLTAVGVVPGRGPFNEDSDYDPFVKAGVPTGGLFSGDAGIKTPREAATWGGRANVPYAPCYHQACDTASNINRVALERMSRALAAAIGRFATGLGDVPSRDQRVAR